MNIIQRLLNRFICFLGKVIFLGNKKKYYQNSPGKILIFRAGMIGDVIMTTPLVKAIKMAYPDSKTIYLVGKWSKTVLDNNPFIDKIIDFEDNIIFKRNIIELLKLIFKMRKEKIELGFILDKSCYFGVLAFLFGVKYRIGFDRYGEGFANNANIFFDGTKSETDCYLDLLKPLGLSSKDKFTSLYPSTYDTFLVGNLLRNYNLKEKIIGIAPGGARNPGQIMDIKQWPLNNYIDLINKLLEKYTDISIFLIGSREDSKICDAILRKTNNNNIINFSGLTTILQSSVLISKCNLFISHDSGPLHIAGASNCKIIALFGPTSSIRFAPLQSIVIEAPNTLSHSYDIYGNFDKNNTSMNNITVNQVLEKIEQNLW